MLAYFSEGAWRARCRLVVTASDGLLAFPLFRTIEVHDGAYTIPAKFNTNTALILGIATKQDESPIKFRIFANDNGSSGDDVYFGEITWKRAMDVVEISDSLTVCGHPNRHRFNSKLYDLVGRPEPRFTPNGEEVRKKFILPLTTMTMTMTIILKSLPKLLRNFKQKPFTIIDQLQFRCILKTTVASAYFAN